MHFGNFRVYSVKIGNLKKVSDTFRKTPDAFRQRSSRKVPGVFRKASETIFLISDPYRSLPTSYGNCRSPLYPCYVKPKKFYSLGQPDLHPLQDNLNSRVFEDCLWHIQLYVFKMDKKKMFWDQKLRKKHIFLPISAL